MAFPSPYKIVPLGENAVVILWENRIDTGLHKTVLTIYRHLQAKMQDVIIDLVPAYSSLTVYYTPEKAISLKPPATSLYNYIRDRIEKSIALVNETADETNTIVKIPVCYDNEYAPDLANLTREKEMTRDEVVNLHSSRIYTVFMIGFLPGFAYLGEVDPGIATPRKRTPRPVKAGAVGIAGSQTGIYPLDSPGGWHIIGQTPVSMFNAQKHPPVTLEAGYKVQFYPISSYEYKNYQEGSAG
ncbi:MAG: 5-oxoprolinase subunit PxpB [Chitinophagaceae bacterium]|nr:5-oxoprolinase subunit PxpB [Chitinophagaceae bacterium]MCW5929318.1 5-oxoprolinase subunit PxpB [Chitinophagaceae bacterium]